MRKFDPLIIYYMKKINLTAVIFKPSPEFYKIRRHIMFFFFANIHILVENFNEATCELGTVFFNLLRYSISVCFDFMLDLVSSTKSCILSTSVLLMQLADELCFIL